MKVGTYIRHFLYRIKGKAIYRYGLVVHNEPQKRIKVLWHPLLNHKKQQSSYIEIIKMEMIEIISEP